MAKPWSGVGAWAAEAEQAEAEAKAANSTIHSSGGGGASTGTGTGLPRDAFPPLGDSMVGSKVPKKKKGQTFALSEFTVGKYVGHGGRNREREMNNSRGLSAEEMMMLPTGPRDRSNEEPEVVGGLGGGFRDYGGFRGGDRIDRGGLGGGDRESRDRGFGGGFDRDRDRDSGRGGDRIGRSRESDYRDDLPSRADEASSWGANKKPFSSSGGSYQGPGGGGDRVGRGGYEEDTRDRGRMSDRDLPSRADEVDNWGSTKKFVPSSALGGGGGSDSFERRGSRGGSGFEDTPRRGGGGGFDEAPGVISRADEVDNWGAAKKFVPSSAPLPERRGSGGGFESTYRDAGSEADRWSRRELPPARDDAPRPAERPRLVLQPRSVPVDSPLPPLLPVDRNGENERPLSSQSSRSDLAAAAGNEIPTLTSTEQQQQPPPKPKPRLNPFGSARPREEVLAEKGQDWRKLDAELDVKRPSSSHSNRSSRPQTPEVGAGGASGGEGGAPRTRPKASPFGEAKPKDSYGVDDRGAARDWRKPSTEVESRPIAGQKPEAEAEAEDRVAKAAAEEALQEQLVSEKESTAEKKAA